jgi:hypothetical protein
MPGIRLASAVLGIAALCACGQTKSARQERFFGRWKFDQSASRLQHADDARNTEWRSYAADGDRVQVAWGAGAERRGGYSARCDGSVESTGPAKIRCWEVDRSTVDGEQLDTADSLHRYYRRVVSADGQRTTITWYGDAQRTRPLDVFVYARVE